MSFVEDLISRAFLSKDGTTLASKGLLLDFEEEEIPTYTPPPPVEEPYSPGHNLGFMVFGRSAPVIKVAARINGVEHKAVAVKNASVGVTIKNADLKSEPRGISVTVSNVNV